MRHLIAVLLFLLLTPSTSWAFCGFFVPSGDTELFTDATQVALMRHGERTVLTMQNNFKGPASKFAMVVPVPEVLTEDNVKTLSKDVFNRLDRSSAPRLVEYFEADPCKNSRSRQDQKFSQASIPTAMPSMEMAKSEEAVTVVAQFQVDEYDIVVLSSEDSVGLEKWLNLHEYNIPDGAAPYLQPYVQAGMYFIVAKVDPTRLAFQDGQAVLSPLRFDYRSKEFSLPVRLGMINSNGEQDLIVYMLGTTRFETTNRKNVNIPTNLEVSGDIKSQFGGFYRELFDQTINENPGAIVTEYAWPVTRKSIPPAGIKCDPCPAPQDLLTPEDLVDLGAEIIDREDLTLTRLHTRYAKDDVGEDLQFKQAAPLAGGTPEPFTAPSGKHLPDFNRFQGRYIIRHHWTGMVKCIDPVFGDWSGGGPQFSTSPNTSGAVAEPKDLDLSELLVSDIDALGIDGDAPSPFPTSACFVQLGEVWIPNPIAMFVIIIAFVSRRRRVKRTKNDES